MGEWIRNGKVVGSCKKITPKFKSMLTKEIYSRDDRGIFRDVIVKRNRKNGDIEVYFDLYDDGEAETVKYVEAILIGAGKYVAEEIKNIKK